MPSPAAAVRAILGAGGVTAAHPGRLLRQRRVGAGREAWLFTNPEGETVTEAVDVTGWDRVGDLLGEPPAREGDTARLTVAPLDVAVLIVEKEGG